MRTPYSRKVDAIRAAKRLGKEFVLYERTGARNGVYWISNTASATVVWQAK